MDGELAVVISSIAVACKQVRLSRSSSAASGTARLSAVPEAARGTGKGCDLDAVIESWTQLLVLIKLGRVSTRRQSISLPDGAAQIASLVNRAGISNLTGLAGAANIQGEDQKKLDVISNDVFCNALRASGRTVWPARKTAFACAMARTSKPGTPVTGMTLCMVSTLEHILLYQWDVSEASSALARGVSGFNCS